MSIIFSLILFSFVNQLFCTQYITISYLPDDEPEAVYEETYAERMTKLREKLIDQSKAGNNTTKHPWNHQRPVLVHIRMSIVHLTINQEEETMQLNGIIYAAWEDRNAVWDPSEYDGIKMIVMKQWELWTPKFRVINSASGFAEHFEIDRHSSLSVYSEQPNHSTVEMYSPYSIKHTCKFDYSAYPYDQQRCYLAMLETRPMSKVQLEVVSMPPIVALSWQQNTDVRKHQTNEWVIKNVNNTIIYFDGRTTNYYETKPIKGLSLENAWSVLLTHVEVKRHNPYYGAAVLLPTIVSFLILVFSFLITTPSSAVYALLANFLFLGLYLQDLLTMLPPAVGGLPKIGYFVGLNILLTTVSLFAQFWFLWMLKTNSDLGVYGTSLLKFRVLLSKQMKLGWKLNVTDNNRLSSCISENDRSLKWRALVDMLRICLAIVLVAVILISSLILLS